MLLSPIAHEDVVCLREVGYIYPGMYLNLEMIARVESFFQGGELELLRVVAGGYAVLFATL